MPKCRQRFSPRLQFLSSQGEARAIGIDIFRARFLIELGFAQQKSGRIRDLALRPDLTITQDHEGAWIAKRHKPARGSSFAPDSIARCENLAPQLSTADIADLTDMRIVNLRALFGRQPE